MAKYRRLSINIYCSSKVVGCCLAPSRSYGRACTSTTLRRLWSRALVHIFDLDQASDQGVGHLETFRALEEASRSTHRYI